MGHPGLLLGVAPAKAPSGTGRPMSDVTPSVPVTLAVAVSEGGTFRVAIVDSHWIAEERKYQQMMKEIRADKQLWSVRYIKTSVPYPVSTETQP